MSMHDIHASTTPLYPAHYTTRVEVVTAEPPRPRTPVTQEQSREWAHHCGGVEGIGMSLEEQRRESMSNVRAFVMIMIADGIGLAVALWSVGLLVRTFWAG